MSSWLFFTGKEEEDGRAGEKNINIRYDIKGW